MSNSDDIARWLTRYKSDVTFAVMEARGIIRYQADKIERLRDKVAELSPYPSWHQERCDEIGQLRAELKTLGLVAASSAHALNEMKERYQRLTFHVMGDPFVAEPLPAVTPEDIGMVRAEPFETFIAGDGKPALRGTTAELWRFTDEQ